MITHTHIYREKANRAQVVQFIHPIHTYLFFNMFITDLKKIIFRNRNFFSFIFSHSSIIMFLFPKNFNLFFKKNAPEKTTKIKAHINKFTKI